MFTLTRQLLRWVAKCKDWLATVTSRYITMPHLKQRGNSSAKERPQNDKGPTCGKNGNAIKARVIKLGIFIPISGISGKVLLLSAAT